MASVTDVDPSTPAAGQVPGPALTADDLARAGWPLARPPLFLETSRPGVFAAGDVRSGSIKRVASAVGEGATAVRMIHQYLTAFGTAS